MRWLSAALIAVCVFCFSQAGAFWQSRDSNYNLAIQSGGGTTTFNPATLGPTGTLTNGNLTIANNSFSNPTSVLSIASHSSGKYFYEVTMGVLTSNTSDVVGVSNSSIGNTQGCNNGTPTGMAMRGDGSVNNTTSSPLDGFNSSNFVDVAVDITNGLVWFFSSTTSRWNASATANPATGTGGASFITSVGTPLFACVSSGWPGDALTANFGATAYSGTVPGGFTNW